MIHSFSNQGAKSVQSTALFPSTAGKPTPTYRSQPIKRITSCSRSFADAHWTAAPLQMRGFAAQNFTTHLQIHSRPLARRYSYRVSMKGKYTKIIYEFCQKEGIDIPIGFGRNSASHLAVVRYDTEKPKLIAKTFFKKEDLHYYISTYLMELPPLASGLIPAKVFDFKENLSYQISMGGTLVPL